jgi:hypothetical protein
MFQRPDAIDVVVEAETIKYRYTLINLVSSGTDRGSFVIQTFSSPTQGISEEGIHIGRFRGSAEEFSSGNWIRFGVMRPQKEVSSGSAIVFLLEAPDLPGIVECRAHGGTLETKGDGEIPPILARQLPLHNVWPHGWTIGPDERLAKNAARRTAQIFDRAPAEDA